MAVTSKNIEYPCGDRTHHGYVAWDDSISGERPGIIVIHEWWGLNDYMQQRADILAELGYCALAIDMYGDGLQASNPDEAGAAMNQVLEDMETGTARLRAAYETLTALELVDASRTAAQGYCFGGAMALHMARIGMPILRTIHGSGIMEGGSFVWLNQHTAVVGRSNQVNEAGARQVEDVLREQGVELLRVDLTGYRLHIAGCIVIVEVDTAIINPVQLPFWFLQKLEELEIRCVEVHPDDPVSTVNCLAISPGRVIMSAGISKATLSRLDSLGIEVIQVEYENMYLGGGGIHCSTCPLVRDSVY